MLLNGRGDLFFLWHSGTGQIFSGYGLAMWPGSNERLSGLLMVDRPWPADPEWLAEVDFSLAGSRHSQRRPGDRGRSPGHDTCQRTHCGPTRQESP